MPAAKFSADGNTLLLVNFPKPPTVGNGQAGYIEGSYHGNTNVFIPLFSAGYNYLEMRIHDFEYCSSKAAGSQPGGMAIGNVIGSAFWRLNCSNAILTGLSAGGSYGDRFDNIHIAMFTAGATKACFHFDAQDNDNIYRDLNCDGGMQSEVVQSGGYGLYVRPYVTDRGNLVYPFVNSAGAAEYIHPFTDMENSNSGFLASLYSNGAWAPVLVYGGQLIAPSPGASGDSFFALNGGQPILDIGSSLDGSPASIVNVISNPASPVTIRDAALPNVPLANSGKSWWVYGKSAAQDLGMKFADLPATAVNGAARYCSDCDPPANPPAACTSSGAKTGAWAHGLNNSWTCAP